jgi:hypothetical protein
MRYCTKHSGCSCIKTKKTFHVKQYFVCPVQYKSSYARVTKRLKWKAGTVSDK